MGLYRDAVYSIHYNLDALEPLLALLLSFTHSRNSCKSSREFAADTRPDVKSSGEPSAGSAVMPPASLTMSMAAAMSHGCETWIKYSIQL